MKKWQEIFFSSLANFSAGLAIIGVARAILDNKDIIASIVIIFASVYIYTAAILIAKNIENKTADNDDDLLMNMLSLEKLGI